MDESDQDPSQAFHPTLPVPRSPTASETAAPVEPSPPALPRATLDAFRRVEAALTLLPAQRLAPPVKSPAPAVDLPSPPSPMRWHRLAEQLVLRHGLRSLGQALDTPPPSAVENDARPDLAALPDAHEMLEAKAGEIERLCRSVGFPRPARVADVTEQALRRVVGQLNAHLRETGGHKLWARRLRPAIGDAERLAEWIEQGLHGPAGAVLAGDCLAPMGADAQQLPLDHLAGRTLVDVLPGQLRLLAYELRQWLDQEESRPPGHPPIPDALLFGAEALCAIWVGHHANPLSMSEKQNGFMTWAEPMLRLAAEANDAARDTRGAGSRLLASTTLKRALQKAISNHRAALAA